ncbi:VWA domain-containing protein [bacterium]|nr:VWA domain-containing protein [bacterium]
MEFQFPAAFLLLILAPLLWVHPKSGESRFKFILPAKLPLSARARWRGPVLNTLKLLTLLCLTTALARPQKQAGFIENESTGKDIILTLDLSGSMKALDFFIGQERVRRVDALKVKSKEFVDHRLGDRIGLVVFAERALLLCPLTLDGSTVKNFIETLHVGIAGQGTAIGDALARSLKLAKNIDQPKSTVIVLVTDGKSNAGAVLPSEASDLAAKLGIKIHVVGIGGVEPAPLEVETPFGKRVVLQEMEYDEKTLREIAEKTGGQYFNAKDTDALSTIYEAIDRLESRRDQGLGLAIYQELYLRFALAALCTLTLEGLLLSTVFRRLP